MKTLSPSRLILCLSALALFLLLLLLLPRGGPTLSTERIPRTEAPATSTVSVSDAGVASTPRKITAPARALRISGPSSAAPEEAASAPATLPTPEAATPIPAPGLVVALGPRYTAKPGSKVRIEGTSNVHDWQVEGTIIGGSFEAGPGFPLDPAGARPGKVEARANVSIPVRALKSVDLDGRPFNAKMDEVMYEKLLEPTYGSIRFVLSELLVKEAAKAAGDPLLLEAKGELAVAGRTNVITMPVEMRVLPQDRLRFSGSVVAKMTDFDIQPPDALGTDIKVGDDVKLSFDWMTGRKEE